MIKVRKLPCNHGKRNSLNEMLHEILKRAIIVKHVIQHKYCQLNL